MWLTKGNYISEWFGQRIYPDVRLEAGALSGKRYGECPFLSETLGAKTSCVKSDNSHGVCTISSISNGPRQDWLACPYRVINSDIVERGCQLIFGLEHRVKPIPVSVLKREGELDRFKKHVREHGAGYLFFQDKLGGEISVLATERSPEMAFDVTLVEICPTSAGGYDVTRYGILELQTMDFHGSYRHAVSNLRDALRLHERDFASALSERPDWASKKVEGPNIANVFKRTFYQVMLKFKLSGKGAAAGMILALPRSVWESWQPFLGAPELETQSNGIRRFAIRDGEKEEHLNSYICVFDLDAKHRAPISPVQILDFIQVSPEKLAHYAFNEVPAHMLHTLSSTDALLKRIRQRLIDWWPDLSVETLPGLEADQ